MTKTDMVAGVLHEAGFNSNPDFCFAFAHAKLVAQAESFEAFRQWDTPVPAAFAQRYIERRRHIESLDWQSLYRELA